MIRRLPLQLPLSGCLGIRQRRRWGLPQRCPIWPLKTLSNSRRCRLLWGWLERRHALWCLEDLGCPVGRLRCGRGPCNGGLGGLLPADLRGANNFRMSWRRGSRRSPGCLLCCRLHLGHRSVPNILPCCWMRHQRLQGPRCLRRSRVGCRYLGKFRRGSRGRPNPVGRPGLEFPCSPLGTIRGLRVRSRLALGVTDA